MAEGGRGCCGVSPGVALGTYSRTVLGGRGRACRQGGGDLSARGWQEHLVEGQWNAQRIPAQVPVRGGFKEGEDTPLQEFCTALVWDEGYIHGRELQEVRREAIGWSQNLETVVEKEEVDELRHLREGAERVRDRGKGVGAKVVKEKAKDKSPGTSGDKSEKRKKKKRKREEARIQGKKPLASLFATTGLDPKVEVRRKVKRRAQKVTRKSRSKRKDSHSTASSSSSSMSDESEALGDRDLFEPATPTQRVWRRCPGALTMSMIAEAKEALLTQLGVAGDPVDGAVPAIATQYVRQVLMPTMSGPVARESHHWGLLLDLLLTAAAADLGHPMPQALGGALQGNETGVATPAGAGGSGKALSEQHFGAQNSGQAGKRRAEGAAEVDVQGGAGQVQGLWQGLEARQGREGWQVRERQERQGRRQKEVTSRGRDGFQAEQKYSGRRDGPMAVVRRRLVARCLLVRRL